MKFTKMQGLGNDYLYVYGDVPDNIRELSVKLSDRHFGAGSDGMIYISRSDNADFKMRIFNADGSEAKMCGNGIRCVGKYVYDRGLTRKTVLTIETLSGIKTLNLFLESGTVKQVSVDMGKGHTGEDLALDLPTQISEVLLNSLADPQVFCTPVDVGNPHAVIFTNDADSVPLEKTGPAIEHHPLFPDGVNVEFVHRTGPNNLRMRVWERGSGITMACGTGACASVFSAVKKGFFGFDEPVFVQLDGGTLEILVKNNGDILMTGPAEFVYDGETEVAI